MDPSSRRRARLSSRCLAAALGLHVVGCAVSRDASSAGTAADADAGAAADAAPALDLGDAGPADAAVVDAAADASAAADAFADAVADADAADSADAQPSADGLADAAAAADVTAVADAGALADAASPTYAAASAGGAVAVDLGGSSDDGTAIVAWGQPGAPAPLIFGPQGGYHVWVSVCTPAALGDKIQLRLTLASADGQPVHPGATEITSKLVEVAGKPGSLCRVAAPAFVTCACELSGQAVRVRAEVSGVAAAGSSAPPPAGWAEKTVVFVHGLGPCWPPGQAPCAALRAPK